MSGSTKIYFVILTLFCLFPFLNFAGTSDDIQMVIKSAYVEGIHIERNPEKVRAGFHPDFIMFVNRDNKVVKITLDDWLSRMKPDGKEKKAEKRPDVTHRFELVNHSGNAAVARVELFRDGKHLFSDYLSLYKFEEGWKIVGKIFHRH